jgi:hypothetical protein
MKNQPEVRTGQAEFPLSKADFEARFRPAATGVRGGD